MAWRTSARVSHANGVGITGAPASERVGEFRLRQGYGGHRRSFSGGVPRGEAPRVMQDNGGRNALEPLGGRARRGSAERLPPNSSEFRLHGHRRADARARHRREHGSVLDLQQPDPASAARARSRQSRAAHRRLMVLSDLERNRDTRDRIVRRRVRLVGPEVRLVGRRSDGTGRWRVRQRPALRRARRHRFPRPNALACRRRRRRSRGRTARSLSSAIVSGGSVSPVPTTSSGASSLCSAFRSRSWA